MGSINRAFLLGNLGADPVVRFTPQGAKVANLSLATSRRWKDRESGEKKQATEWHRVVIWGRQADVAEEYLKKGSPVHIEGELRTRSYEKDGVKRYVTEVVARRLQLVGKAEQPSEPAPSTEEPPSEDAPELPDDDTPF